MFESERKLLPSRTLRPAKTRLTRVLLLVLASVLPHAWARTAEEPASREARTRLRTAELDDSRGCLPAAAYAKVASVLETMPDQGSELRGVLERGLKVAIRDGDLVRAAWFGTRLTAAGGGEEVGLLGKLRKGSRNTVVIPGGMKSLMFAAHGRQPGLPERFLVEYARTVLAQYSSIQGENEVVDRICDHFKCVQALEALGTRSGSQVSFSLSARDDQARQSAAKVLDLLGWQLEVQQGRVVASAAEHGSRSGRQINAASLDIDELAMYVQFW